MLGLVELVSHEFYITSKAVFGKIDFHICSRNVETINDLCVNIEDSRCLLFQEIRINYHMSLLRK